MLTRGVTGSLLVTSMKLECGPGDCDEPSKITSTLIDPDDGTTPEAGLKLTNEEARVESENDSGRLPEFEIVSVWVSSAGTRSLELSEAGVTPMIGGRAPVPVTARVTEGCTGSSLAKVRTP